MWITDSVAREMILDMDRYIVLDDVVCARKQTETDDFTINLRYPMDFGGGCLIST